MLHGKEDCFHFSEKKGSQYALFYVMDELRAAQNSSFILDKKVIQTSILLRLVFQCKITYNINERDRNKKPVLELFLVSLN